MAEVAKTEEKVVEKPHEPAITKADLDAAHKRGWNGAVDAMLNRLHEQDERGPVGERAGLQHTFEMVRELRKK